MDNGKQSESEQRNDSDINKRHRTAHDKRHGQSENQHQRRSHGDTDNHHECLLNIGHVCGKSCHKTWRRKFVNIGKGKILYLVVQITAQVFCETCRCRCAEMTGKRTADKGSKSESDKDETVFQDYIHVLIILNNVDKLRRDKGNDTFDNNLECYKNRRQDCFLCIALNAFCKSFQHSLPSCPLDAGIPFSEIYKIKNKSLHIICSQRLFPDSGAFV